MYFSLVYLLGIGAVVLVVILAIVLLISRRWGRQSARKGKSMNSFEQMEAVIAQRRAEPQENSYTCYLFEKGLDKILKKVGEECAETIIAAKNGDKEELIGEINDVFYHMMVMMNECGVTMADVCAEMDKRAEKIGNLKKFHVSDHNT